MKRIVLLAMFISSPAWAEVGLVVEAEGGLIIRGTETIVAESGTPVDAGDLLQTTPTGLIHVLLSDETKFVVGPGTAISIDTALIGADSGTFESLAVGITGGLFRMISGNSESDAYQVNTPTATMGIRGTAFDNCVVRENLLIVHQGIVQTCLRNPVTGEPDLASCTDTAAEENACGVVSALVGPNGDGTVAPAERTAILQCRLSYQQEELGVLEDFRIDDLACRAAAETARQSTQPEEPPPDEPPPPEEEEDVDETENTVPSGGSDQALATGSASSTVASGLLLSGGGGGSEDLCSKTDLLATLEERAGIYEGLIEDSAGDDAAILLYRAALRTLRSAILDVERAQLRDDDCDTLQATLATACSPPQSPAAAQDGCVIDVPARGF